LTRLKDFKSEDILLVLIKKNQILKVATNETSTLH